MNAAGNNLETLFRAAFPRRDFSLIYFLSKGRA